MEKYSVQIKNQDGSADSIIISAESEREALDMATAQGYEALEASKVQVEKSRSFSLFSGVPDSELFHFTRLFATLTRAGIPILETLELLVGRINNLNLRNALEDITDSISEGNGIKTSFQKHPKIFERSYVQLLEVGEESGKLPQVLERLTILLRKRIQLRGMIIKSLTYPILVMIISFVVVVAILVKIVPRFKDIYSRFGGDLPALTQFTLQCSDILVNYFPAFMVVVLALLAIFHFGKKTGPGKRIYDHLVLSLPLFGQMFHTYEIAGFSNNFSMLVHSGITVNSSLDLIGQSTERIPIKNAIYQANELIRTGRPMAESFDSQVPWMPDLLNRMVAVGERSGNLSEMLEHVADFYEEEFNNKVDTLASLIEPALIVFLGVIIGGIVVSLYLPIFGMARLIAQR